MKEEIIARSYTQQLINKQIKPNETKLFHENLI